MPQLKIAVIGGTGALGSGLAWRWAKAGAEVFIGSRSPEKARAAAEALTQRPVGSLNHTKALMRDMDRIAMQISREGALFRERLQTGEAREAFAAFAQRRKPDFSKITG